MKYYSVLRPVGIGTFPKVAPVNEIHNFDRRQFVEELGREAWGWIDYEQTIPEKSARAYDLVGPF